MFQKSSVAALLISIFTLTLTAFSVSASGPVENLQQTPPATLTIETVVNLGIEAGSGVTPQYLAHNLGDDLLYVLSEGIPAQQTGNSLNVFDTNTGEFTAQTFINEGDNEPLDLQFDSGSGQIFALWRDRYGGTRPILSVIESATLQPVQDIPDVEAFTAANGQLYAANADELFTVNLANNSIDEASRVSLDTGTTGPMALDILNNRLYLARAISGNWSIEIFETDTLAPVASYAAQSSVQAIAPHPTTGELFFTTQEGNFRMLYRLSMDGELADLPYELGPYFGKTGIAISPDGATLFYSNGQLRPFGPDDPTESPALIGLDTTTLTDLTTSPCSITSPICWSRPQTSFTPWPPLITIFILSTPSARHLTLPIQKSLCATCWLSRKAAICTFPIVPIAFACLMAKPLMCWPRPA